MPRRAKPASTLDTELAELPPALRWREWMGRVEAVIFAAPEPVTRDVLAQVVGRDCAIDLIIADIREELRGRPYDLVAVAGGWQHRTRGAFAPAIRAVSRAPQPTAGLSPTEMLFLSGIAYLQPITRSELGKVFGKEMSRDSVAALKRAGVIAAGPRSPEPGAPYTYVTTDQFLSVFGLASLSELPVPDLHCSPSTSGVSRMAMSRCTRERRSLPAFRVRRFTAGADPSETFAVKR